MLSAAETRKFKSLGGILKTILFFLYLVEIFPWAPFQQGVWAGAPGRRQSRRGKGDAPCLAVRSHAVSGSSRKCWPAGVKGERKINRANSDFYEVSGADSSGQLLPCDFFIEEVNSWVQALRDLSSAACYIQKYFWGKGGYRDFRPRYFFSFYRNISVYSDVVSGLWQLLSKPAALASPEGIITHVNSQAHSLMVERHWLCQVFSHLFSRGALKIASKEDRASMSIFILQME